MPKVSMGVGSWEQGSRAPLPPRIFIHGTVIVDNDLIVLFFGLFYIFSLFSLPPP